ncbi:MAG: metalloregulator ArsR/SmtB family transcription factor [Pseudomonadota bacterium]
MMPACTATELDSADARAHAVSDLLSHIANPVRFRIVCRLTRGEASVGELLRILRVSQSSLSQHLARLRNAGLVRTRRQSKSIYYELTSPQISAVVTTLRQFRWSDDEPPRLN